MARTRALSTEQREWITDGEKFALIGLSVNAADSLNRRDLNTDVRVLSGLAFSVPAQWREWLGSLKVDEIEGCNLFILATSTTSPPSVLDAENQRLERLVFNFYIALLLASGFRPSHDPVRITGAREDGVVDVRQHATEPAPVGSVVTGYPQILSDHLDEAALLCSGIERLRDPGRTGWSWHLVRTLTVYVRACSTPDMMDRIHQFTRCIEGLIAPDAGNTRSQFKSRTELFIGPKSHGLMGEIFDIRSSVEHLHEVDYLHPFVRDKRLGILKMEAIVSDVARQCLRRVLASGQLRSHFGNIDALRDFWQLPAAERGVLWGSAIDPLNVLDGFRDDYVNDGTLGA